MNMDAYDLKFNFGCASCGYKQISEDAPLGMIPVSRIIEKLDGFFYKNDMESAGRLLSQWHEEASALRDKSGELSVVNEMLGYYRKMGEREKGLWSVERSLKLLRELDMTECVSGATVMLNAATTLKAFGKSEEAMPLYDTVFGIYSAQLTPSDARLGGFYNNKALALADLSRFEESEECYKKALAVMEQVDGGKPDCAVTYVNMAHLYEKWLGADSDKISECLDSAYAILDGSDITRDSYYAYVCSKCAPSFDYFGYFAAASELSERSREIYERA